MRLLLVSAAHHPTHGGIGTAVSLFVKHALAAGWEIELMTRQSEFLPKCHRIHVVHTKDEDAAFAHSIEPLRRIHRIRPYRYGSWSLAVAQSLLEVDGVFDAIGFIDSQAEGFVSLSSARVRRKFAGIPMYVHAHTPMWLIESQSGMNERQFGRAIYHQWERRAMAAADGVCAPSRLLLNQFDQCVTKALVPHMLPETTVEREECDNTCLFVGNIEPNKGVDCWALSLNEALRTRGHATALMIGRDTPTAPGGGSMVEHVRSLISPEIVARCVWKAHCSHEVVQQHIARAAVVVVPSRFESFSYVAAEAVLRCVPVIVTDQVGLVEYARDLTRVPVGDHESLAHAQIEVMQTPTSAQMRVAKCREQLIRACCPRAALDHFECFVQSLRSSDAFVGRSTDAIDEMHEFLDSIEKQAKITHMPGGRYAAADCS